MSLFISIFKYVWPHMRKYKTQLFLAIFIFSLRVILDSILKPLVFKKIIDTISNSTYQTVLAQKLYLLLFLVIGISVVIFLISRVGKFLHVNFEIKVIKNLYELCFKKITNNSYSFFSNTFSGSLVTKSRRFVSSFENMFDIFVYDFLSIFIAVIGMLIVVGTQSKILALFFVLWIFIYFFIILYFVKGKLKYDLLEATADSKIGGHMADVFGNILAMKIFSNRKSEVQSFSLVTKDASEKSSQTWNYFLKIEVLQSALNVIIQSILLYLLITLWLKGSITTGTVVLVQTYTLILLDRLWGFGKSFTRFMKLSADMKEMIDIFETPQDIIDPINPESLNIKQGHLVFDKVSFSYKNGQKVFDNFSIDIKPGERIGLVGHSGAGKSTFTNLILRFSDVDSGSVTIDGQDVRKLLQDDLRSAISYVPQESILFHRTIRENIAYGKNNATDEDVMEVAKKAYAHDFIEKLPYKYETYVGERGVKLSGGERQRIAIARAMIKDAPILILDEATSSLDSLSEHYIQDAFNELMKGKTTIVIAHRLSTIQKMDRILVLEDGKIVEEGNHKELLEKGGNYSDLWNRQVGGFIQ
jgi:ATP-binding cassette, subfamily B, bacterial